MKFRLRSICVDGRIGYADICLRSREPKVDGIGKGHIPRI